MLPAILVVVELVGYAITAYEMYRTASNAYGEVKNFQDSIQKAKAEIKKIMKDLGQEISDKIDKEKDKVLLTTLTTGDKHLVN
ncbi:hypothetical protein ACX1N0_00340 [Acinetobacter sp. ANC 4635]|uniref:hypothetical protein n=1 Tax=Acinetobacter sp. ANC 4635 TaxID=2529846 RepID=UPI001D1907AB|nr:hypothetical protein [Acinetobacter sp. ANC 4635]